MKHIKNDISYYRKQLGLTQTDFARLVGTSKTTISAIETYTFGCSLRLAVKISKALNVPIDKVFDFSSI